MAAEIQASISYYVKQENLNDESRILLSGIGARVTGLADLLQAKLGVTVEVAQPLANLSQSQQAEVDVSVPEFAVSVGLALRGLEPEK